MDRWDGTGNNSFLMEDANAQVGANLLMGSDVSNNWGKLNLYHNANDGTANNQTVKINGSVQNPYSVSVPAQPVYQSEHNALLRFPGR